MPNINELTLAKELIKFPSVTPRDAGAIGFLEKQLKTMKVDKPLVFVCSTGARSGEAYYMVQDLRPDIKKAYYVEAEITFNEGGGFQIKPTQ